MKQAIILVALLLLTAGGSKIYGQVTPLPATGDKDLRDTDVKRRSIELERIDRETKKNGKTEGTSTNKTEDPLAAKYGEIKIDYEQIQLSQDSIIKAYQTGDKVDYAQIGKAALEINKSAIRLRSNLFPAVEKSSAEKDDKKEKKTEIETKSVKSVRDLIVELDNTIGSFVASPMFQNLRTVDAAVSEKARLDLEKIIELSAALKAEARKVETTE